MLYAHFDRGGMDNIDYHSILINPRMFTTYGLIHGQNFPLRMIPTVFFELLQGVAFAIKK